VRGILQALILVLSATAIAAQDNAPAGQDAAGKAVLENLKKNRGGDYSTVVQVIEGKTAILVVKGHFDEVQKVLDGLNIKYELVEPGDFASRDLSKYLAVFVNCYGEPAPQGGPNAAGAPKTVPADLKDKVRKYVNDGGYLFSSDWAIALTEAAFPEYIKRGGHTAPQNESIPVHAANFDTSHPFLKDVFTLDIKDSNAKKKVTKAEWMIERASLTFEVNPSALDKVKTLLVSEELQKKYQSQLVAVTFTPKGGGSIITGGSKAKRKAGVVFHVIGHFYQQGLGNQNDQEVARMYQMILNFIVEAKKAQASEGK
jgi:hypothetical protein